MTRSLRPYKGGEPVGETGVAPRPGMEIHHNAECSMELQYMKLTATEQVRGWWCETHGQWAYERPVIARFTWADGTVSTLD